MMENNKISVKNKNGAKLCVVVDTKGEGKKNTCGQVYFEVPKAKDIVKKGNLN